MLFDTRAGKGISNDAPDRAKTRALNVPKTISATRANWRTRVVRGGAVAPSRAGQPASPCK